MKELPSSPSKIDTTVLCYEDQEHTENGQLCIEDYTLEGVERASVMCFADWGEQRCSSCAYFDNICYDDDSRGWQGGYKLSCSNIFPNIRSMTVCENRISYNHALGPGGSNTVVLMIILLVLLIRAFLAWSCPSPLARGPAAYQTVPVEEDDRDSGLPTINESSSSSSNEQWTTELPPVKPKLASTNGHVAVE